MAGASFVSPILSGDDEYFRHTNLAEPVPPLTTCLSIALAERALLGVHPLVAKKYPQLSAYRTAMVKVISGVLPSMEKMTVVSAISAMSAPPQVKRSSGEELLEALCSDLSPAPEDSVLWWDTKNDASSTRSNHSWGRAYNEKKVAGSSFDWSENYKSTFHNGRTTANGFEPLRKSVCLPPDPEASFRSLRSLCCLLGGDSSTDIQVDDALMRLGRSGSLINGLNYCLKVLAVDVLDALAHASETSFHEGRSALIRHAQKTLKKFASFTPDPSNFGSNKIVDAEQYIFSVVAGNASDACLSKLPHFLRAPGQLLTEKFAEDSLPDPFLPLLTFGLHCLADLPVRFHLDCLGRRDCYPPLPSPHRVLRRWLGGGLAVLPEDQRCIDENYGRIPVQSLFDIYVELRASPSPTALGIPSSSPGSKEAAPEEYHGAFSSYTVPSDHTVGRIRYPRGRDDPSVKWQRYVERLTASEEQVGRVPSWRAGIACTSCNKTYVASLKTFAPGCGHWLCSDCFEAIPKRAEAGEGCNYCNLLYIRSLPPPQPKSLDDTRYYYLTLSPFAAVSASVSS